MRVAGRALGRVRMVGRPPAGTFRREDGLLAGGIPRKIRFTRFIVISGIVVVVVDRSSGFVMNVRQVRNIREIVGLRADLLARNRRQVRHRRDSPPRE
ncbi:hypothetical protein Q0Z83_087290 [Actinoplanes sichuanensis]|nr:hypothetical protein Q0Z83_087290 [Actinoplanes sichuanensis]